MPKIALRLFAIILALLGGLSARAAGAAEIKVLCSGAMRALLQQLAPAFEKLGRLAGLAQGAPFGVP